MKIIKISMLVLTFSLMSFVSNTNIKISTEKVANAVSGILWKSEEIDLGEIPQNQPKSIVFEFKNTGKNDVIITNVKASCGCTATDYTKTPVKPGQTAKITAVFNAAAKGTFKKNITVTTNSEETPKILAFKGIVI